MPGSGAFPEPVASPAVAARSRPETSANPVCPRHPANHRNSLRYLSPFGRTPALPSLLPTSTMTLSPPLDLEAILPLVRKPGQYIGGELHAESGRMTAEDLTFCLVFPDLYEIGMSHQGLQILYHLLNARERVVAHRAYAPDVDMEAALRRAGLPLFSLEARVGLGSYDVLGITLPYELCYTNILTVLDLAGLPFRAADRDDGHPLVLGGGSCAFNPEPVADFFDAIVLGDGEEVIIEIADLLLGAKKEGLARAAVLDRLAAVRGVYVPALFAPRYRDGRLEAIEPLRPDHGFVQRRVLAELGDAPHLRRPLVPVVKPVHDRLGVEIARGCTRGCRFCQAGMLYRPVRERSLDDILELAEAGIAAGGFEELALLSLSTGDFSCLDRLMVELMDRFSNEHVSVSMPSMRVGTLTPEIMEQIKRVRKTGFTVAPEAGTDRLREVINKGITEADLLATCRDAFALGWKLIKLYFMVGLPTETDEDVEAIVELARKARQQAGQGRGRPPQVNLGVATFVPKPHTPFQWAGQLSLEESKRRINRLKQLLPAKGFKLKWHDPEQSFLEGVFARGDRRLAHLLETAWQRGARFDSWSEHFSLERWQQAAVDCGIDLDSYLRPRGTDEVLPWDHLHCGVDRSFLEAERDRALARAYTPDCRVHGCQGCGLCDFRTVRPLVQPAPPPRPVAPPPYPVARPGGQPPPTFAYRVHYRRTGDSRFYGHLELLQLVFRALQRAGLPLAFSHGFNPSPQVGFSQALPVGVESEVEYWDMALTRPLPDPAAAVSRLNDRLPATIRVAAVEQAPRGTAACSLLTYEVRASALSRDEVEERLAAFLTGEQFVIDRFRKNRHKELDIRPLVARLERRDTTLVMDLLCHQGQPGVSPREILEQVLGLTGEEALLAAIRKTAAREMAQPS